MNDNAPSSDEINDFLIRVIETEENYAFAKKGQDSARKEKIRNILDGFCEKGDQK